MLFTRFFECEIISLQEIYGIGRTDSEFRADQAPEVAVKLGVDLSSEEGKAERNGG